LESADVKQAKSNSVFVFNLRQWYTTCGARISFLNYLTNSLEVVVEGLKRQQTWSLTISNHLQSSEHIVMLLGSLYGHFARNVPTKSLYAFIIELIRVYVQSTIASGTLGPWPLSY
jgi:hypothetical protein